VPKEKGRLPGTNEQEKKRSRGKNRGAESGFHSLSQGGGWAGIKIGGCGERAGHKGVRWWESEYKNEKKTTKIAGRDETQIFQKGVSAPKRKHKHETTIELHGTYPSKGKKKKQKRGEDERGLFVKREGSRLHTATR